jgi:hypothetical protein
MSRCFGAWQNIRWLCRFAPALSYLCLESFRLSVRWKSQASDASPTWTNVATVSQRCTWANSMTPSKFPSPRPASATSSALGKAPKVHEPCLNSCRRRSSWKWVFWVPRRLSIVFYCLVVWGPTSAALSLQWCCLTETSWLLCLEFTHELVDDHAPPFSLGSLTVDFMLASETCQFSRVFSEGFVGLQFWQIQSIWIRVRASN